MIQTRSGTLPDIAELHVHFLAILSNVEQYAKHAHRHLVNFHDREDAIAETVALSWAWYYKLGKRGEHMMVSPILLVHNAVRSVRSGKRLSERDA